MLLDYGTTNVLSKCHVFIRKIINYKLKIKTNMIGYAW